MVDNGNWLIVVAGGKGKRMGAKMNKSFLSILGEPIILHTLKVMEDTPLINKVVVAIGSNEAKKLKNILRTVRLKKIVGFAAAGKERQDTSFNALKWLKKHGARPDDLVGIHNAVNPLVTPKEVEAVFLATGKSGGALLAMPAKDTVKIANNSGFVRQTPIRKNVWYAQTPQVGRFKDFLKAFLLAKKDNFQGTDDTQLLERIEVKVKIVPCSLENFKITYPEDLILAEAIFKKRKND